MNWLKKPPEEMTPEEAKKSRNSKKKKAFFIIFFVLIYMFIVLFFVLNNTTKTPTDSDVYTNETNKATVGKYYEDDFSPINPWLGSGNSGPYTYYLVSGVGVPPMGLKLDPSSGVLSGTPKVAGTSNFEVCVKDTTGELESCLKVSLEVYTAATKTCPANSHFESSSDSSKCLCDTGYKTNSAGNGCVIASAPTPPKNNVVQGTRTEKWEGTYTNRKVFDNSAWVCTYDATAPISICLTWQGQNFSGPINFPNGFKEASYPDDPTECPIPPHCSGGDGGQCSEVVGYTDSSGNLKLSSLTLDGSAEYAAGVNSAVMNGNSMTVEYSRVSHSYGTTSNKGSFTATKVSDSCK